MKKNPNTTLAGSSLPRRDTALPEVDSAGEVIGSPDREQQGWIEDEHGNRVLWANTVHGTGHAGAVAKAFRIGRL